MRDPLNLVRDPLRQDWKEALEEEILRLLNGREMSPLDLYKKCHAKWWYMPLDSFGQSLELLLKKKRIKITVFDFDFIDEIKDGPNGVMSVFLTTVPAKS